MSKKRLEAVGSVATEGYARWSFAGMCICVVIWLRLSSDGPKALCLRVRPHWALLRHPVRLCYHFPCRCRPSQAQSPRWGGVRYTNCESYIVYNTARELDDRNKLSILRACHDQCLVSEFTGSQTNMPTFPA